MKPTDLELTENAAKFCGIRGPEILNYADAVKGHFCIGRQKGDSIYWEYYFKGGWCAFAEVFTNITEAQRLLAKVSFNPLEDRNDLARVECALLELNKKLPVPQKYYIEFATVLDEPIYIIGQDVIIKEGALADYPRAILELAWQLRKEKQ